MGRPLKGGGNAERRIVFDDARLKRLHAEGKTIVEIAAVHGCSAHPVKMALRRLGLSRTHGPRPGAVAGKKNPAWKGGRRIRQDGYVEIWTTSGHRLEHQVVMEREIGRPLARGEVVHHIDGNKSNNNPANLKVTTQADHIREHLTDMHAARYGK